MKKKKMLLIICIIAAIISISTVSIISVNAETPTPSLTIASNTLELKNAVFMNFKVSAKNISDTSSVKLLVWEEIPSEYTMESAPLAISSIRTEDSTGYLVFQYDNLSAKDMTKFIYVCAYADIDGNAVYSKPVKFSILQYAQTVLNSEASSEELKTLVSNMLDYGAMAQIYFDHNTELLATDTIAKIKVVNGVHADGFKTGYYKAGTSVTLTANAAEDGYVFSHWENSSGNVVGTESTLTISKCVSETYTAMYRNATSSIQYRYRDKQYTTSTTELEEPWILYDTVAETEHGATVKVYLTEDEAIDTNVYCVHYKTSVCKYMHPTNSTYKWVNSSSSDHNYYYTYGDTKYWHYDDYYCYSCCHVSAKTTTTEYYYYSWSEWSKWSDTPITATSNREVEVRGVFTITYDANGGTNPPVAQSKAFGESIIITSSVPTRDGYTFKGWSSTSNGTVEYNSGDVYSIDNSITLYAVWEANTYTINYDANGGENVPEAQTKTHGVDITLSTATPTREGYTFEGWATSANGAVEYIVGDTYSLNCEITLYAVWEVEETITILASGTCGNNLTWILTEEGVLNISGQGSMSEFSTIASNRSPWYNYASSIKNIIIDDGVTTLGAYAFYYCQNLTSITIPESVTSIGSYAFEYCKCINNVYINDLITWCNIEFSFVSNPMYYGAGLYLDGELVTAIIIPDSITSIGDHTFEGCTSLTSVTITDSVTSIGDHAFDGCTSLTSVTITDSVTSIGDHAFDDCTSLTSIIIPESVTSIGFYAFEECTNLADVYITDVEAWLNISFGNYSSHPNYYGILHIIDDKGDEVTEIIIPDTVISIDSYVFKGCTSLTSITIPNSVTSIGYDAFSGCSSLETITLPFVGRSIKTSSSTDQYPFGYIFGTDNYIGGVETTQSYLCDSNSYTQEIYYIPSSLKSVTITGGEILYGAFYNCSKLESITITNNVTNIGRYAFYNCKKLKDIVLPNSITNINFAAFKNCISLTSIVIPNELTDIGSYAFSGCTNLMHVFMPDNQISIGNNVFDNASLVTKYYYRENKPTVTGNYWHYDENGNPVVW